MKLKETAYVFILLGCLVSPFPALSGESVFSKSPLEMAQEKADERTRELLKEIQRKAYYRGVILDYELLSRHTQVPQNIIEAAAEMSSKTGVDRNELVIDFAEMVGQYIAEGKSVRESVHATLSDHPDVADELLRRAITRVKQNPVGGAVRVNADGNGHFWGTAKVDGSDVQMLIDTGASFVILTLEDAEKVGIALDQISFDVPIYTAAEKKLFGTAKVQKFEIFGASFQNVEVLVSPTRELGVVSLLGMSVLKHFSNVSFSGGQLVIRP